MNVRPVTLAVIVFVLATSAMPGAALADPGAGAAVSAVSGLHATWWEGGGEDGVEIGMDLRIFRTARGGNRSTSEYEDPYAEAGIAAFLAHWRCDSSGYDCVHFSSEGRWPLESGVLEVDPLLRYARFEGNIGPYEVVATFTASGQLEVGERLQHEMVPESPHTWANACVWAGRSAEATLTSPNLDVGLERYATSGGAMWHEIWPIAMAGSGGQDIPRMGCDFPLW